MPDVPNLEQETEPVAPVTIEPTQPIVEPTVPTIDYEKKFAESTRENQLLREAEAARVRAEQEKTKEPTDLDYRTAFPDWDVLDDSQKADKRRLLNAERTASQAVQIARDLQSKESWNTSLELAIASTPTLQGKEELFKKFASRPQYRNAPMELLVSSFLGAPTTAEAPKPTPKPGLETGNGGPRTPEKPKTLSATELAALRKSDEREYMKYVQTHDVNVDDL